MDQHDSGNGNNDVGHIGTYHERFTRRIAIGAGFISLLSLVVGIFSAWSAWDSSSYAKKSLIVNQSPYIKVDIATSYNKDNKKIIPIIFRNFGKSPAFIGKVCFSIDLKIDNNTDKCIINKDYHGYNIFPGDNINATLVVDERTDMLNFFKNGGIYIIYGKVEYLDQLNTHYTQNFCVNTSIRDGIAYAGPVCDDHNNMFSSYMK